MTKENLREEYENETGEKHGNALFSTTDYACWLEKRMVKSYSIPDVSHSGYICHVGKERVFIIAENIAQAMDKMEEIAGNSVFGCSMESHSSIRVIYCI